MSGGLKVQLGRARIVLAHCEGSEGLVMLDHVANLRC